MINASIIGATGYIGGELLRLLHNHPRVRIRSITSRSYTGKKYGEVFENCRHMNDLILEEENIEEIAKESDVIFLALPHGLAMQKVNGDILSNTKIIDLSADFRLKDWQVYEKWYGVEHNAKELLSEAVYGLCEIKRDEIKQARLIANPGCYTTCSILSLYPLIKEGVLDPDSIIIDAKSGISGAGRAPSLGLHYAEANETTKAYKVAAHRHTPEIEEQLFNTTLTFTPHLIPMNRGVLATCYGKLSDTSNPLRYKDISEIFQSYYGDEFFIRLTGDGVLPETKWVRASNFMDIGFVIDERTNRVIVVGALDNMVKGAAGQAVQNMNILFGFDEKTGLDGLPTFP